MTVGKSRHADRINSVKLDRLEFDLMALARHRQVQPDIGCHPEVVFGVEQQRVDTV